MKITMKSPKYRVINVLKQTKAKIFTDIKVGDIIQFSTPIEYAGSNRGNTYAVDVKIENLNNKDVSYKTFNQLPKLLEHFNLEEVEE